MNNFLIRDYLPSKTAVAARLAAQLQAVAARLAAPLPADVRAPGVPDAQVPAAGPVIVPAPIQVPAVGFQPVIPPPRIPGGIQFLNFLVLKNFSKNLIMVTFWVIILVKNLIMVTYWVIILVLIGRSTIRAPPFRRQQFFIL